MTNAEQNLKVAKECGATIEKHQRTAVAGPYYNISSVTFHSLTELDAYTARICAEKDAEIARLSRRTPDAWVEIERLNLIEIQLREQLSTANAAIAMKDEALKAVVDYKVYSADWINEIPKLRGIAIKAISTSPESIASWEAEKLLPLQRQVAMLVSAIRSVEFESFSRDMAGESVRDVVGYEADEKLCLAVNATQATAEAFMNEHAAKVLEDAALYLELNWTHYVDGTGKIIKTKAAEFIRKYAELRAANKK